MDDADFLQRLTGVLTATRIVADVWADEDEYAIAVMESLDDDAPHNRHALPILRVIEEYDEDMVVDGLDEPTMRWIRLVRRLSADDRRELERLILDAEADSGGAQSRE